jgi:hypothetical protein
MNLIVNEALNRYRALEAVPRGLKQGSPAPAD